LYVEHLRKALKIHVIGFYADSSPRYLHYRVPYQNRDAIKKTFRTDKLVALPDFDGYEKFILINTKPDTAPELEEGMTKAKMRSTLRKQGAGRKFQKSISNELMETICKNFA
jgi:hypothetical protein